MTKSQTSEPKIKATTLLPRKNGQPIRISKSSLWDKWFKLKKSNRLVFLFRGRDFHGSAEKMKLRVTIEAVTRSKKVAVGIDGDVVAFVVLGDR